jgi:hypothetical protein
MTLYSKYFSISLLENKDALLCNLKTTVTPNNFKTLIKYDSIQFDILLFNIQCIFKFTELFQ